MYHRTSWSPRKGAMDPISARTWSDSRITLLYKKGDPRDDSNYRPIAVSSCMYQTPCKLILLRLKKPPTDALSPQQTGGRKGHTTVTQALALWSNTLQFEGDGYIVLLDIAKAFPSTPHPLLWETMYTPGVPPTMISILGMHMNTPSAASRRKANNTRTTKNGGVKEAALFPHSFYASCMNVSTVPCRGGSQR